MKLLRNLAVLTILIGLSLTLYQCWLWTVANRSSHWPAVQGEIVSRTDLGGVKTIAVPDTMGGPSSTFESSNYRIQVAYKYEVDGSEYRSERQSFGHEGASPTPHGSSEESTASYRAGQAVDVYYDPSSPGSAVLRPGVGPVLYRRMGFGIALLTLGLVCLGLTRLAADDGKQQ